MFQLNNFNLHYLIQFRLSCLSSIGTIQLLLVEIVLAKSVNMLIYKIYKMSLIMHENIHILKYC